MPSHESTANQARSTVRAQPLIAVRDVRRSSDWYTRLLGAERTSVSMHSDHAHIYDRLLSGGSLILQLHAWGEHDHANLVRPEGKSQGNGFLLWFEVDDFDAAVKRARDLNAKILREPHVNPAPQHREIWIEDVDGYVVVIASPDGEAP
jgi:catechol 2,3-dioxygenase-like lactoylglutathione lyase family enzyme